MSVAMMQNAISRRRLSQRRALLGGTRGTAGDRTGTPTRPTTSHAGRLAGPPKAPAEIRCLYGHAGRFREGVAVSREEVMP